MPAAFYDFHDGAAATDAAGGGGWRKLRHAVRAVAPVSPMPLSPLPDDAAGLSPLSPTHGRGRGRAVRFSLPTKAPRDPAAAAAAATAGAVAGAVGAGAGLGAALERLRRVREALARSALQAGPDGNKSGSDKSPDLSATSEDDLEPGEWRGADGSLPLPDLSAPVVAGGGNGGGEEEEEEGEEEEEESDEEEEDDRVFPLQVDHLFAEVPCRSPS